MNKKYSYGLFDVGNSAYLIVTLSFIFGPYFAKEIVGDIQLGSAYWQWTSGAVGILVGLTAPFIGSYADYVANGRIKVLIVSRSEEHTSELQSRSDLVCRLLLEKKKKKKKNKKQNQ